MDVADNGDQPAGVNNTCLDRPSPPRLGCSSPPPA